MPMVEVSNGGTDVHTVYVNSRNGRDNDDWITIVIDGQTVVDYGWFHHDASWTFKIEGDVITPQ